MAKTNIMFNNAEYSIDESVLAPATAELKSHLSTVMNGSGAVINLGGTDYNVDSAKLAAAANDFIAHLGTIAGSGSKVVINGVEYSVDSTKIADALSGLQDAFGDLENGGASSEVTFTIRVQTGPEEWFEDGGIVSAGTTWAEWCAEENAKHVANGYPADVSGDYWQNRDGYVYGYMIDSYVADSNGYTPLWDSEIIGGEYSGSKSPKSSTIAFTINGVQYTAHVGTTWEQWNDEVGHFPTYDDVGLGMPEHMHILAGDRSAIPLSFIHSENGTVCLTDEIIDGQAYTYEV